MNDSTLLSDTPDTFPLGKGMVRRGVKVTGRGIVTGRRTPDVNYPLSLSTNSEVEEGGKGLRV